MTICKCTYLANSQNLDLVILEVYWRHYSYFGHLHIGQKNHMIQLRWMKRKIGSTSRNFFERQFHQQIESYHHHRWTCLKLELYRRSQLPGNLPRYSWLLQECSDHRWCNGWIKMIWFGFALLKTTMIAKSVFRLLTFAIIPNISPYQSFLGSEVLDIDPEEPWKLHIQLKANRIVISFLINYFNTDFLVYWAHMRNFI